jgi:hypothetical protein
MWMLPLIRSGEVDPIFVRKSFVRTLTISKLLAQQLDVRPSSAGNQFSRLRLLKTDVEGMDINMMNAAMDFYVNITSSTIATNQFPCVLLYEDWMRMQDPMLPTRLSNELKYVHVSIDTIVSEEDVDGKGDTASENVMFINCRCTDEDFIVVSGILAPTVPNVAELLLNRRTQLCSTE